MTSLESSTRIIAPILGGWIIAVHPSWLGWIGGVLFSIGVMIASSINPAVKPEIEPQSTPGT
jgi:hypothetical protein